MFKFALHKKTAKHTCEAKCGGTKLLGVLNNERCAPRCAISSELVTQANAPANFFLAELSC